MNSQIENLHIEIEHQLNKIREEFPEVYLNLEEGVINEEDVKNHPSAADLEDYLDSVKTLYKNCVINKKRSNRKPLKE